MVDNEITLEKLIDYLESEQDTKYIKDKKGLISALEELNSFIGNEKIKKSIIQQTAFLLNEKKQKRLNKSMLNTCIYGPPGTGKTSIGVIMAKIWNSLGCLNRVSEKGRDTIDMIKGVVDPTGKTVGNDSIIGWIFLGIIAIYFLCMAIKTGSKIGWKTLLILSALVIVGIIILSIIYRTPNIHIDEADITIQQKHKEKNNCSIIASRDNFVGEYVGWSGPKTQKLLESNIGKVIIIDEAYTLASSGMDSFGMEALTTLTKFMSERPNDVIVIFIGYEDKLKQTIFKLQPGLRRRCMWHFVCPGYTGQELYEIFKYQLAKDGWNIENKKAIKQLFINNENIFKEYGGDTDRLIFYSKLQNTKDKCLRNECETDTLTLEQIQKGMVSLMENNSNIQ